jgi:hypothetical protein
MEFPRLKKWYLKYERHLSSASLLGGFVFDIFALKRVDLFIENLWVVLHLLMAMAGIFFLNLYEKRHPKEKDSRLVQPGRIWLTIIIQFAFGGLFSTFLVFYFRSATLITSWPFFLLLGAAFAGNELLKKHYSRLVFQIAQLFLSVYSFAIFALPLLFHKIGTGIFLLSGLVSIIVLAGFIALLRLAVHEHFNKSKWILRVTIAVMTVVINLLYFSNLIPPIPLALKDAGAYHLVQKSSVSLYTISTEQSSIWDYFKAYQPFHSAGGPVYVYSAVFSPTKLDTTVVHHWQYYDDAKKSWVDYGNIKLSIIGGRDGGFRTYSVVFNPHPGRWRVDVETERGQVIGRIKFEVIQSAKEPALVTQTK